MFLGRVPLGEDLVFPAQCIDTAGSAANVDAAGVPAYVVIEDEAALVAAGVMVQPFGQVGFYLETLTIVNPTYSVGSTYNIRISATVDAETPAAAHNFVVIDPIGDQVWDEPTAGHAFAQTFGALGYMVSQYINQVVADAGNTVSTFRTDYGLALESIVLGKVLAIGGNGAVRIITAYDPATDFVTIAPPLDFIPAGGTPIPVLNIPSFPASDAVGIADAVWDEAKAGHQGETIMGNIAEDTDNLQFRGEEG